MKVQFVSILLCCLLCCMPQSAQAQNTIKSEQAKKEKQEKKKEKVKEKDRQKEKRDKAKREKGNAEDNRPAPPDFFAKDPQPLPVWMQYERVEAEEPVDAVKARLKRFSDQTFQIDTIQYCGPNAVDIVVFGDGYTASEQEKFSGDVEKNFQYLFTTSPFHLYKQFFNLYAMHIISQESGVSHPGSYQKNEDGTWMQREDGSYVTFCPENNPMPIQNKRTFFGVSLDGWGVHRLCGYYGQQTVKDLLRVYFPRCKYAGILSNTSEYGGAGGEVLIATCNEASSEIYVHELAHQFGDLADEYFGGDVYLEEKPNMTSKQDSAKVRWSRWLGEPEVGIFPYQGTERAARYFKPTSAGSESLYCKMERLGKEFCPVCRERLIEAIHEQVNPIEIVSPADSVLSPLKQNEKITFRLDKIYEATDGKTNICWYVDGSLRAKDVRSIELSAEDLPADTPHEIAVTVEDENPWVRNPQHRRFHTAGHKWLIARTR